MATHNLNLGDEHLLDQVTDAETLKERIPRMSEFFEGVQEMKALQAEISQLGAFTRKSGFTPGKNFQRVATIPYSVVAAIVEVDPEFFRTKDKVYRWLLAHPEYDTRTKL